MSLLLVPPELLKAILKFAVQSLGLNHALRLQLVCRNAPVPKLSFPLLLTIEGRFKEEVLDAVIATDMLQAHCKVPNHVPLLTEYLIHKTLVTRSSNQGLPSTINRVIDLLLQNVGQQNNKNLRHAYTCTLCKAAVAHVDSQHLFKALKPDFDVVESGYGWRGGSDHVAIAAVCLNISPAVDALSTHSSHFFGFALPVAASQGHFLMTQKLLSHSLPNMDSIKAEAVFCAARAGQYQVIRLLMSSQNTQWSLDAVYGAAEGGQVALLTSLLEGMEKYEDDHSVAAVMFYYSAEKGNLDLLKLALLTGRMYLHGSNDQNKRLDFLIHTAASRGHAEVVRLLLASGAKVSAALLAKPLVAAARRGFTTIVRMLLDAGAGIDEGWEGPLAAASRAGQAEMVRFLLDRDANIKGNYGLRALTAAAGRGWVSVVEMLIDEGVAVVGSEEKDRTLNPMDMAMSGGHEHVVQLLLRKRATSTDPSSIDT